MIVVQNLDTAKKRSSRHISHWTGVLAVQSSFRSFSGACCSDSGGQSEIDMGNVLADKLGLSYVFGGGWLLDWPLVGICDVNVDEFNFHLGALERRCCLDVMETFGGGVGTTNVCS